MAPSQRVWTTAVEVDGQERAEPEQVEAERELADRLAALEAALDTEAGYYDHRIQ